DLVGNQPVILLAGHEGAVVGLAFSTDGARLYSAGSDKTIRAWNVADAKEIGKIAATAEFRALAILHGDTRLATADADQVIRIWEVATIGQQPAPLRELKGHSKPVHCLAPVGTDRLLSGGDDGRLRLWNTATGETVREFDHGAPVTALAVRPDGKRLASAGANGVVRLWNADDGAMVAEIKGDPRAARAVTRAEAALHYAKACVDYRKQEHREAEEQLKRETGVVEGAVKAKEQAEKTLAEKSEAAQKAIAARTAAEEAAKPAAQALAAAMQARLAAQTAADEAEKGVTQAAADASKAREAAAQDKENKDLAAARDATEKTLSEAKQKKQAADAALQKETQALREAQRKNEEAMRAARQAGPEPTDEGPFVLIREGRPVAGHITLHDALGAAAAGDTIEIRTDGPFDGADTTEGTSAKP
ncbi:MAG TPA: hypothetical protein PK867_08730, partial [Pirellulales bacterium]|nr:hypothetical protein [Pirellulales bacterium]